MCVSESEGEIEEVRKRHRLRQGVRQWQGQGRLTDWMIS